MERNLRLYPLYQVGVAAMFWVPVFFLYFSSVATVEQVLWLEAIYYAAVVILEVPSGYFSDVVGRRTTLIASAVALCLAYTLFAATASFGWFVVAQLCLALGMALRSGTDSALLYESLDAVDRTAEMSRIEGRAMSWAFVTSAGASVVGGLLASFDARAAYLASAIGVVLAFVIATLFTEPKRQPAEHPGKQLRACTQALRDRTTGWLALFVVLMIVFNHIPWELTQPYVALAFPAQSGFAPTPTIVGSVGAAGMLIAAYVSRRAASIRAKLGQWPTLLIAMATQGLVIATLGFVHPVLCVVLTLRSSPRALMVPVLNAAIHARVADSNRATFLSMLSLAGRLAFSLTLVAASQAIADPAELSAPGLRRLAVFGAAMLAVCLLIFGAVAMRERRAAADSEKPASL
ncbi:MAG: MFS transporter [Myxococcales bacterium FL481]|nr:MAG: MFS transporter [Myxococcales bacterium FL481]